MIKIIIRKFPIDIYLERIECSDKSFFYTDLFEEAPLVKYALESMQKKIAAGEDGWFGTNILYFYIEKSGLVFIENSYRTELKTKMSFELLKKIINTWLEFDEKKYKKIIVKLDIEKNIFELEGFEAFSQEDYDYLEKDKLDDEKKI